MSTPLQQRIAKLRQRVVRLHAWQAWGWAAAVSLAALLVAGQLDASFQWRAWPLRLLLTAGVVAAMAWAVRRWLVPWWHGSVSEVQLARRLEQLHPVLGETLSSAIAFLRQSRDDPRDGSRELRYAVVADAEAIAGDLPLEEALDARSARRAWIVVAALGLLAAALCLSQPANFGRAAVRLAWPFGGPAWPPRHQLELIAAPTAVALGESFEVQVVDRRGKLPSDAVISLQFPNSNRKSERHSLQRRGDKLVFRLEQVLADFRYQVAGGGDDSLPWLDLTVVQPPKLTDLVTAIRPPDYSGLKPERSGRLVKLLAGSELSLEGRLDRPASAVRLQSVEGELLPPVQLSADRLSFHTLGTNGTPNRSAWQPIKSRQVWIELVDETGAVTGRDGPLEVKVIDDAPPTIAWDQPGDHTAFTHQAIIPIHAVVKDDVAVRRVELRFAPIGSQAVEPQVVVLWEQPRPEVKTLGEGDARTIAATLDLTEVVALVGEGSSLSLQLAAFDFLGQQTQAPPRRMSLISPQDMQHRLVQRQGAVLEQLGEVLRLQRQARGLVSDVVARQEVAEKWEPRDLDVLQSADLQQRQVQRLLANPDDGLARQIELLLAELAANRLQDDGIATRMKSLRQQVARLNSDILPALEEQLSAALKNARLREDDPGACADEDEPLPLAGVVQRQDLAVAALEAMLGELTQWDNFSRIAREVGLLKQEQRKLREQAEKVRIALALSPRDAEALNSARQTTQRQLEAARQYDKLPGRMETLLAKLRDSDARAAGSLAAALDAARRLAIGGQMRSAARQLQESRAGQAVQTQDQVLVGLSEILDRLASRQEEDTRRQLEALTAAASELDRLGQRGETLAREATAAAQSPDPQQRQLQRLTKDAQRLAAEVAELARKLERLPARQASESLGKAGQDLAGSGQAAAAGDGAAAERQAKSAVAAMLQAREALRRQIQQAQADLVREQLARLETELAALVKRQRNLLDNTRQVEAAREPKTGQLSPARRSSLRELAEEQRLLAGAVEQSSLAFESGETFQLALDGARQQMQRAHRGLVRGQSDASVQTAQQQAIARLEQLLAAAQLQANEPAADQPERNPEQEQANNGPPRVRSLGELQLLEQLQLEINRRTAEIEAARAKAGEFTAEQLVELDELSAEQGKLAEIVIQLVTEPAPEVDLPPELPAPAQGQPLDDELLKDLK